MEREQLKYLLERYRSNTATPAEVDELQAVLDSEGNKELLSGMMEGQLTQFSQPGFDFTPFQRLSLEVLEIDKGIYHQEKVHFLRHWWWAAAAIVVLLGIGTYWGITGKNNMQPAIAVTPADIAPGRNGAILTLANGTQVVLDSLGNGIVATQNGTSVWMKNGELTYAPAGQAAADVSYNTTTTPKGRQFQLVLPDGTKAWLNAGSSITYPTAFTGKERVVKVAGEVYLEIARNAQMPFLVNVGDRAAIEVLGTRFNVNAYTNEDAINTTLLEGSIKVRDSQQEQVTLKPGELAQIKDAAIRVISNADTSKVVAWKNGAFDFNGLTLQEVMRQLERWYDIEIVFKGTGSGQVFWGKMDRNVSLADVLDMFKDMGIKYQWNDHTLTVL